MTTTVKDLIKQYTQEMNDYKDLYNHWSDSMYWVYRTYERVIEDLKQLDTDNKDEVVVMKCTKCWIGELDHTNSVCKHLFVSE